MISEDYKKQVSLVLDALPIVAQHDYFALKGGTALNLFYAELPRLSVDIDLCYIPVKDRKGSFAEMHTGLEQISEGLSKRLGCRVTPTKPLHTLSETRLIVEREHIKIKIEPNYIIRGTVYPTEYRTTSSKVEDTFKKSAEISCLSIEDLWGGKFCAALDRQHPRDLFDVHQFFEHHDFNNQVKTAFIFYLLSHNRPIEEVLAPTSKDISGIFQSEFKGMSSIELDPKELCQKLWDLKALILDSLNKNDKEFLISIYTKEPKWSLYEYKDAKEHPSIKWKLQNISKMTIKKTAGCQKKLEALLTT
ncbi:nucleotidyl transferase AbiEii/AbiGii toxin family protein [Pseudobacteriovorax antillogorgiicola]|uniref:Nucleotidyl transferase AbiEii toxin, Type IV TA system n=1 Tax=Pseudobacteriovorax antillogorgiicola TaxID=1513793 RepID=A0A1Y6B6T8_9BACT|nr:nucleotidyl transferase AbiEii/AbiGii toxin family protein [Pseudobacteriovorax antillogorgiicola]TCS58755.1 nucleotidyltransferase AbiEii toxin of type IV toxin-antitoxin system [Pseudobacteriovorax antillogorgiicola]SME95048.1 Nucleotidyl transferase AbiEii toxin, Type IV TA system [Pseudobacteriovorax antillogorgiicola]